MSIETNAIEKTVQNYFNAYLNADAEALLQSFDAQTVLLSVEQGSLAKTPMKNWLDNLEQRKQKGDIRNANTAILSLEQTGEMAYVKASLAFESFTFVDYLSLLKLDGAWKIVGKIYTVQ